MRAYIVNGFSMLLMSLGFASVIWVTSSLTGAARSQTDNPTDIKSSVAVAPAASEPAAADLMPAEYAPSPVTTEGYVYDPTGRRDPFQPVLPELKRKAGEDVVLSTDPLQAFEVYQYKVIGIMWEINNPRAMVKDPQGKLYTIKKETKIGRNNGFVSSIREGAVLVVEPAFGDGGTQTAVTRVMLLSK